MALVRVVCGRFGVLVLIVFQTVLRMKTCPCQKREAARADIVAAAKTRPAFLIMVSMMSGMTIWLVADEPWIRSGMRSPATGTALAVMIERPGRAAGGLERD